MFSVKGAHTFFMPVDTAFDVSVHVSGQDNDNLYNRGISRNVGSSIQTYQSKQVQPDGLYLVPSKDTYL